MCALFSFYRCHLVSPGFEATATDLRRDVRCCARGVSARKETHLPDYRILSFVTVRDASSRTIAIASGVLFIGGFADYGVAIHSETLFSASAFKPYRAAAFYSSMRFGN